MRRRGDTPRTDGGARRADTEAAAAEALERRYRRLLAWYPAAYRAANADDMLGVALARSASGQRWPEPGEAVNLIVSGIGERLGGILPRPDQRDTASVLAIAGPVLLAATAGRTVAGRFIYTHDLGPAGGHRGLAERRALRRHPDPDGRRDRRAAARRAPTGRRPLAAAFVTTALVCWGFRGFLPGGLPLGLLMLSPLQWQDLVLVPVIGVVACFIGLRLYERRLRRRETEQAG